MPESHPHTIPVSDDLILRAVLDAAASLIVVVDTEGGLVYWNRACENLSGYSADELAGAEAVLDLIPEEERSAAIGVLEALSRGESPVLVETHWRTRSGDLRLISWSNTALTDPDGRVTHVVGTGIDVTETRGLEDRLRYLADHDALTGLINRRRFEEELERHLVVGRRYGMTGALLVLDLDGFKAVNDTHGHRAGDHVLCAVAEALRRRLRESDVVARIGGDEFAVLLPRAAPDEAERVCGSLEAAIPEEVAAAGEHRIEVSVGFAAFAEGVRSVDDILTAADASMYAVKAGRSRSGGRKHPARPGAHGKESPRP
jgi:diguanylate cyclase (GGDEF)-like protein/PAS domain S-box-containing protein